MAFNLRGTQPIADGSITESKLADDAVTASKLATDSVTVDAIATGAVTEGKIATDAVTTTKIANSAVDNSKIGDGQVSIAKVDIAVSQQHFLGTEVELSLTGDTEATIGEFNFTKNTSGQADNYKHISYSTRFTSNDVGNTASVKLYVDSVLKSTVSTTSITDYIDGEDSIDISALADGKHLVEIKAVNDQPTGITTVKQLDVYLSQK